MQAVVFQIALNIVIKILGSISAEDLAKFRDKLITLIQELSKKAQAGHLVGVEGKTITSGSPASSEYAYFLIK